jgi:hypothetical protein
MTYTAVAVEWAMKVQEVILRALSGQLTWAQVEEVLGVSARTIRRLRWRYARYGYLLSQRGAARLRAARPSPRARWAAAWPTGDPRWLAGGRDERTPGSVASPTRNRHAVLRIRLSDLDLPRAAAPVRAPRCAGPGDLRRSVQPVGHGPHCRPEATCRFGRRPGTRRALGKPRPRPRQVSHARRSGREWTALHGADTLTSSGGQVAPLVEHRTENPLK